MPIHEAYRGGQRAFRNLRLAHVNFGDDLIGNKSPVRDFKNADFSGSELVACRFVGADLRGADFSGTNLHLSNFVRVNGDSAKFKGAYLGHAKLGLADFREADFNASDMSGCDFYSTDFSGALLRDVDLTDTDFGRTRLNGARLTRVAIGNARLVDTDLSALCASSLQPGRHSGVAVDWRSIARSLTVPRSKLKRFLVRTGMPDVVAEDLIDSVQADSADVLRLLMCSTFISYGGPDEEFAIRVRDALRANGVDSFLFASDAPPGERLHNVMRQGINSYDRVIVICSQSSLDRPGVQNEIEQTLEREARDGGASYLIPIRIDDYLFNDWDPERRYLVEALKSRVVGDFRSARNSRAKFQTAMRQVLSVLKKPTRRSLLRRRPTS
jgi:uncharacterized protein YjbI with pentapeptide repeats